MNTSMSSVVLAAAALVLVAGALAARLPENQQPTTTLSPARLPIFREAENTDGQQQQVDADEDYAEIRGLRVRCKLPKQSYRKPSAKATERLLKDLKKLLESDSYKQGMFSITFYEDSLYWWKIKLLKLPDPDSLLSGDLKKLKEMGLEDSIDFDAIFDGEYPRLLPSCRFYYPPMKEEWMETDNGTGFCPNIHILDETEDLETIINSIAASLVERHARVLFNQTSNHEVNKARKLN